MKAKLIIAVLVAGVLALPPLSAVALEPATARAAADSAIADSPITSAPAGIESPVGTESPAVRSALEPAAVASTYDAERAMILQQVNTLRAQNGLPALRLNTALHEIAQDWSVQQARVSTMSHRPDFTAWYPAGWSRAGENVAAGYSPSAVVAAWAGSPGHRANMLSNATDIGIGIAANASGRLYYTQNFGRYSSAPPVPPGAISRIAGADRFATSALISTRSFPAGARTVYVASGADFPDALSAAALAGAAGGPLLLVQQSGVPAVILTELRRLDPDRIVVAGGTGVVSDAVLATLRTVAPSVSRVFGSDRYDTARALARDAYGASGAPVVYLATGDGYADALAAGPAAASVDAPVVLVAGSDENVDDATLALLDELRTTRVVIVGGTGVVSEGIRLGLAAAGLTVERIAGADRYTTASLLASRHFPGATSGYLATGSGFADALSGGAAAGALGAPLYTSRPDCVSPPAHAGLRTQDPDTILLLGGLGSLQPSVAGFYRC